MADIFESNWSETDGSNNQASPNGYADNAAPSTIKACGRMMMGALKRWFNLTSPVYTTAGSATALTLTPSIAISAYATGLTVDCILGTDVDANATLNVSGKGAKKIYVQGQAGLRQPFSNEARTTNRVRFSYNASLDSAAGGWVMRDQPLAGAAAGRVLTANGADAEPTFQPPLTNNTVFSAHKNGTDQTGIAASTSTKVTFTTEVFDTGGFYDAANSKFLPTDAGKYLITAAVLFTGGVVSGALYEIAIFKNGSIEKWGPEAVGGSSGALGCGLSALVDMNGSTDFVEIYAFGAGAGNKTINGSASQTYFQGVKVG